MLQDDYIKQCFINASKKKKNRNDVREVLENLDEHTELLKKMLTEELFIPDYHKPSIINESSSKKTRRILKPHYKYEQVIHHCAIGQFKPIVMNGLYEFSCGCIPGRGVHYGKKYMRKWLDSYDGKKFFILKMDIHHFFESINRRILKRKLKDAIRDKQFYRLLCILIEHLFLFSYICNCTHQNALNYTSRYIVFSYHFIYLFVYFLFCLLEYCRHVILFPSHTILVSVLTLPELSFYNSNLLVLHLH